jgi:23S rRNA (uracil1939-C5)-methyltransferase
VQSFCTLYPEKIVYISCNPETQKRDIEQMKKAGYRAKTIIPVDQFPFTKHVECVVLMSNK